MTSIPILQTRMRASADTPYLARQVVGCVTANMPVIRSFDVALLTSELVSLWAGACDTVDVTIDETGRSFRIAVACQPTQTADLDEIAVALLDRLATNWRQDEDTIWFEIETVPRRSLGALSDGELFAMLPDHDARSEIFDRFVGFATALARRFTRSRVMFDDLEQVAGLALVKAIDRFDPDYGAAFTTFAAETIKGELKRHLRDTSWSMRVPRGLKDASLSVRRTEAELTQTLGRPPTLEEVAEGADLDLETVLEARRASHAYSTESIDAPMGDDDLSISLASVLGSEDPALERAEAWHAVEKAMEELEDRERRILYLRFFEDMSQSEIAEEVGVSQMHVSRLLARSIQDIRDSIGGVDVERGDV